MTLEFATSQFVPFSILGLLCSTTEKISLINANVNENINNNNDNDNGNGNDNVTVKYDDNVCQRRVHRLKTRLK